MSFVISSAPRYHRVEFGAPDDLSLTFREFRDEEERSQFDRDLSAAINHPSQKFSELFETLLAKTASALLVDWAGILGPDEDSTAVKPTDAMRHAFFSDPESRKYWRPWIHSYLFPVSKTTQIREDPRKVDPFSSTSTSSSSMSDNGSSSQDPSTRGVFHATNAPIAELIG